MADAITDDEALQAALTSAQSDVDDALDAVVAAERAILENTSDDQEVIDGLYSDLDDANVALSEAIATKDAAYAATQDGCRIALVQAIKASNDAQALAESLIK